ncbi:MAG: hypothetical protein ACFFFT_05500 [Candidatus Thorarchaeota archaeon]
MVPSKKYYQFNREERFYCFLFAHTLLSSKDVKLNFIKLCKSKFGINFNSDELEVYIEAAILRDFWSDLGDPNEYSELTHQNRLEVIKNILGYCGYQMSIIEENEFFWTNGFNSKLWSPGRWDEKTLEKSGLEKLKSIKWSFNAKPDIMLISNQNVLLIEAKVESFEGVDIERGYHQKKIQELISELIPILIPYYKNYTIKNTSLELHPATGISWAEIAEIISASDVDDFTKNCFADLIERYKLN